MSEEKASCCQTRNKVIVGIFDVLSQEDCGIYDQELADFMLFDVTTPEGKPVIMFKYCPWCGTEIDMKNMKLNITDVKEEQDEGESWKSDENTSD